jgi:ABC-2 type transport system permease protein
VAGLAQVWVLISHQLRGRWRSLLIWGVILGALGALYVALYPSMSRFLEDYLENASDSMRQYLGDLQGPITIEQWLGMEYLNVLVPVALPFMVIIMGARSVAGREERKTLDLLLSTPLQRLQVVAGAVGTMALSLAAVLVVTWVLTYIAVPFAGVDLAPQRLAGALVAVWVMCLLFGALALLLSALVRRGALAIAIPGFILITMYVIAGLAEAVESVRFLRVFSLFYHLGNPVEGDFPWTAVLSMLFGTIVLTAAAAASFSKRDIYT